MTIAPLFFLADGVRVLNGNWGMMDARWTAWRALHDIPFSTWLAFRPLIAICGISLISFSLVAVYLICKRREKLAAIAVSAAMIPGGLSMMEAVALFFTRRCGTISQSAPRRRRRYDL
jgi:hypothetical protein